MDFGDLGDVLDDDIGYIPTALRKDEKQKQRPASLSRQNSTKSIGSMKEKQEERDFKINSNVNDVFSAASKESPKSNSFVNEQEQRISPTRKNTLFGLHKQTTKNQTLNSNQGPPISFEDFFKNQSNPQGNTQPQSRPPLPEKKIQKVPSYTDLNSPQNIIEDDFNNSSVASRRGRPPLNRKNPNITANEGQILQNKSQYVPPSKPYQFGNQVMMPQNSSLFNASNKLSQVKPTKSMNTPLAPNPQTSTVISSPFLQKSIQQLKTLFSSQLQHQKQSFQALIKQQRQAHAQQIQKLKQSHQQQLQSKLKIKEFELQKIKQFYELQLRLYKERQIEIRQYNTINKKLQSNILTIQKLQRNYKDNDSKDKREREQEKQSQIRIQLQEIKKKQTQHQYKTSSFQTQKSQFKRQKQEIAKSLSQQKHRIYDLQQQLHRKEQELIKKYKKIQSNLQLEYQQKEKKLQKKLQQNHLELIRMNEQKNIIEMEKQQFINNKKLYENERKNNLEDLHQQRTKILEKEIQIATKVGELQIKEQQIYMNQSEYINKLKLIQLEKKKLEIQKKSSKGQLYLANTTMGVGTLGLQNSRSYLGINNNLAKTNQSALNKEFYANDGYEKEPFELQSSYKKSVLQMRDEFLKSLPKF